MPSSNFYIYRDKDGKMPQLTRKPWASKSHPYYTKYLNDRPVKTVPYPGQNAVWDYSINEFVTLDTGLPLRGVAVCYG